MTEKTGLLTHVGDGVERVPLSLQLDFLRLMDSDRESGPFGPRYTLVAGWRVFGEIDLDRLRGALFDVVSRHEILRTRIVLDDGDAYQSPLPPKAPDLVIRELGARDPADRERSVEDFLNEVEEGVQVGEGVPRIRAVLGRFDRTDGVLVFVAHHTAIDGWSFHVLMRDFATFYAARGGHQVSALPEARQYREYVAWQRANADGPAVAAARAFWREHLRGARMLPFPTDRPRSVGRYVTGWHRFSYEEELRQAILAMARKTRSSPFMVVLAAFLTLMRERTGETDLVVPTLMAGRQPAWTQDVVGVFYNFMPLRANLSGCTDPLEIVSRVRASCLAAYQHELPFMQIVAEAPELMAAVAQPDAAAIAFQLIQNPFALGGEQVGELRYAAVRRRVVPTPIGSQIPDGILAELDLHPDGGIFGKVAYVKHLFDEATITALMDDFRRVLHDTVTTG